MEQGNKKRLVIVGGGAAGFFAANVLASKTDAVEIIMLERSPKTLSKVKISGGGRCNVTHACFSAGPLSKNYPRGANRLKKAFKHFQPQDTIDWFKERGVELKTEADNRMFPTTDSSQTIIDCFQKGVIEHGVQVRKGLGVQSYEQEGEKWRLSLTDGSTLTTDFVLVATGSDRRTFEALEKLGHSIVPPVPSLFTFVIKNDPRLDGLSGVAMPAKVRVAGSKLQEEGPFLITHWGVSGPAILRLSAWGAKELHEKNYTFTLQTNFAPEFHFDGLREALTSIKEENNKKKVCGNTQFGLPSRLWKRLTEISGIPEEMRWGDVGKKQLNKLATEIAQGEYQVTGKATFKDEFVTAGGVDLPEVNFSTMESNIFPNLYFAGEVLNIDAITGGFNFQAAWTTAWLAMQGVASKFEHE